MNVFYTPSGIPATDTKGKSAPVRDELANIGLGFDAVEARFEAAETELSNKADLAGATFTGPVKLPTVAVGDADQSKAVNLAAALAILGAGGALIPPTAGQAGKVLATLDGTSYSWQASAPFPAPANAFGVPRVNASGSVYAMRALTAFGDGGIRVVTTTGAVDDTRTVLDLSSAAYGTLATLPDARTLPQGFSYIMSQGVAANAAGVVDAGGGLLAATQAAAGTVLSLTDNTTLAGAWKTVSGALAVAAVAGFRYVLSPITSLTTGTGEGAARAVAYVGPNEVLVASGRSATRQVSLYWLTVTDLAVTVKASVVVGTAAAEAVGDVQLAQTAAGEFILVFNANSTIYASGITLVGGGTPSVTATAVQTVMTNYATAGVSKAAANGNKVLMVSPSAGFNGFSVRAAQFSGGTLTVSAATASFGVGLFNNGVAVDVQAVPGVADKFVVVGGANDTISPNATTRAAVVSLAGLVVTVGATVTPVAAYSAIQVRVLDSTKALLCYIDASNQATVRAVAVDTGANTLTLGTATVWATSVAAGVSASTGMELFDAGAKLMLWAAGQSALALRVRSATVAAGAVTLSGSAVSTVNAGAAVAAGRIAVTPGGAVFALPGLAQAYHITKDGVPAPALIELGVVAASGQAAYSNRQASMALIDSMRFVVAEDAANADLRVRAIKFGE